MCQLKPARAVLIDSNEELINFYLTVRDHLEELLADLRKHENKADYYYHIRALNPAKLNSVERASPVSLPEQDRLQRPVEGQPAGEAQRPFRAVQ